MAGKSNKGGKSKGKNGGSGKVSPADLAAGAAGLSAGRPEPVETEAKPSQNPEESPKMNPAVPVLETTSEESSVAKKVEDGEMKDGDNAGLEEDELRLYPMTVKGPSGEQMELQVNPGDSVMDLRQFLLDAPETCFYTCYDLILKSADGMRYHLAEYLEIGEVADVAAGGCTLEMVNALYDDRSVRSHVRRTRDLISTANLHSSLSTALATEYEEKQAASGQREEGETSSSASDAKSKSVSEKEAGSPKAESTELHGLGFMDDTAGLLAALVSSPPEPESCCIESIAFSSFNPVPGYRR